MNGSTNVQVIGWAAGLTTILFWLMGYFVPELMESAPVGLEAGFTAVITALAGLVFKPNAGTEMLPGRGE